VIGVKSAIMPILYIPDRFLGSDLRQAGVQMTADDWKWNADFLNEKAAVLKKAGIVAGYHNHNFEFAPLGHQRHGDPAEGHGSQPGHLRDGRRLGHGRRPRSVRLLKAHPGRFTQMHVKDIKATTKTNFELKQDPTEVGGGMIDWKKLLPAAYAAGVRGFYYEQEPPFAHPGWSRPRSATTTWPRSSPDELAAAPLRLAMVGGGPGSFIGPVHRMAAELDGRIRLVAGVFSRDPERTPRRPPPGASRPIGSIRTITR
jgi:hypothetical protein